MNDAFSKKSYRGCLILVFVLALVPRLILTYLNHSPLRTPMDELSTMSSAAYLAGFDWQEIVQASKHYYGAGFTVLLTPLFYFISNPYVLYAAVLCVAGIVQSLTAPIAFHLMYKYFDVRDKRVLFMGALIASYCVIVKNTCYYNEHIIGLLFWIIIWILCILVKEQEDHKKKVKWSILLMLTVCYSMTIHTRSQIYFIALFIAVLIYLFVYRKWLVSPVAAALTAAAGYAGAKLFINWVKVAIYTYQEGNQLKNTSVSMNLSKELLTNPTSWEGWLSTIIGQVHTSVIFTTGLVAITIPVMIVLVYRTFLQASVFSRKVAVREKEPVSDLEKPYIFVIALVCILCIGGTIFAQSLTWLERVSTALTDHTYSSNAYGYKAYTYIRYYGSYIGPFLLAGMVLLYRTGDLVKRYWGYILTFFVTLQMIFCCFVLPHITNNRYASLNYWPFALWNSETSGMRTYVYVAGLFASVIGFTLFFVSYLKKKKAVPFALVLVVLLYQYGYCSMEQDGNYMDRYNAVVDATYSLVTMLEENEEEIPKTLYFQDVSNTSMKRTYTAQFMLKDYSVALTLPDESSGTDIVFSNIAGREVLIERGYSYAALDDNEYVYVKTDGEMMEMLEGYGYTFTDEVVEE